MRGSFTPGDAPERPADRETRRHNLRRAGSLFRPHRARLGTVLGLIFFSAGLGMPAVLRLVLLARAMQSAGNEVRFCCPARARYRVARAGLVPVLADPQQFLFSVREPDETVKQAAESAVREVIGSSGLSSIMPDQQQAPVQVETAKDAGTAGTAPPAPPDAAPLPPNPSAELAGAAQKVLQATLNRYDTGLLVQQLNFQNVRPPQEVKEAFDDAIHAVVHRRIDVRVIVRPMVGHAGPCPPAEVAQQPTRVARLSAQPRKQFAPPVERA